MINLWSMLTILPMLVKLEEKDKRLLIALFIVFIVAFVLIAYIGNGIKALMKRFSKGIDKYMHDLCVYGLVKNPKEFRKQVFIRETKQLYLSTRWAFRIGLAITAGLLLYTFIVKPSGDGPLLEYYGEALANLQIHLEWPKGEFFGIQSFPVDWPIVTKWPTPEFNVESIVTYLTFSGYLYVGFILIISNMKFIARLIRARTKSVDVFTKSLDNLQVDGEEINDKE